MRKKKGFIQFVVISLVVTILSLFLSASKTDDVRKSLTPFYEALQYMLNYYYERDSIDLDKLIDSAIDGLTKGLGDDFSYYHSAEEMEEERIEMGGEYGGLGIEVTYDREYKAVKVIAPMYGTPAWRVGLKSGDLIVKIDGQPVNKMTYMEAVRKLRGKPGTKVKIEVIREGVDEPLVFEIVREKIVLVPVKYSILETPKGRVGYVKITRFISTTSEETKKALKDIFETGVKGIILDLRNNPGGLLTSAIEVASFFIDKGVIVKVKNTYGVEDAYETLGNDFPNVPIVVLVNEGSASASEIVTGALKDHGIAKVVGKKTFGKGSVQTGFPLSNGGVLYLTTAHYMTPSGKDIHRIGIKPDVIVKEEAERPHEVDVEEYTKVRIRVDPEKDPVLKKGLEVLLEMIE